jgi:hypothetical protein
VLEAIFGLKNSEKVNFYSSVYRSFTGYITKKLLKNFFLSIPANKGKYDVIKKKGGVVEYLH